MDIFTTLRSQYDSFSKTQRRIADYLLDRPDIVCFSSLRELAAATSTTEATVLSFARKIGFSNFVEMRSEMRAYASQWMSPNKKIASAVQDAPDSDLYASIRETEKQALVQTFQRTGEETLRQAAALLQDARRVFLLAYDYAVTASQFFAARFLRLGVDVLDLGGKGVPEILYRLAMYRPGDLFVLFSYPPYTPMPIELAQWFREKGAKVICFTDDPASPAAQSSDLVLSSVTQNEIFFNSMTATSSLITQLGAVYVTENRERHTAFSEELFQLQGLIKQC